MLRKERGLRYLQMGEGVQPWRTAATSEKVDQVSLTFTGKNV